jgi:rhodanese-related sulfurtransferase
VWVHCAAGFRATIAASILERAGIRCAIVDDLIDVAAELGRAGVAGTAADARTEHQDAPARVAIAPIAA